jgi:hypothetical protein
VPIVRGKLGDLLAARLNVPILFLNAGFNGTSIESWFVTSIGGSASNIYLGGYYPNRLPYSGLESVLQYFVPLLGARSIFGAKVRRIIILFEHLNPIIQQSFKLLSQKQESNLGKISLGSFHKPQPVLRPIIVTLPMHLSHGSLY